jgi:hypothetical protein
MNGLSDRSCAHSCLMPLCRHPVEARQKNYRNLSICTRRLQSSYYSIQSNYFKVVSGLRKTNEKLRITRSRLIGRMYFLCGLFYETVSITD